MKLNMWLWTAAVIVMFAPTHGQAQRTSSRGTAIQPNFQYDDISRRSTQRTEREERRKKEAEEARKKAEEEKRNKERQERRQRYEQERREREEGRNKKDEGENNAQARRPADKRAPAPRAAAAAEAPVDPTTREVTDVMLDSVRTRTVDFEPARASDNPGLLLLNPPKYDNTNRTRAGDYGIGQAL